MKARMRALQIGCFVLLWALIQPAWAARAGDSAAVLLSADPLEGHRAALSSTNAAIRLGAAEALSRLDDPRTVPLLVKSLGDPDAAVRLPAARALGRFGDPAAVEPLVRLLGECDAEPPKPAALAAGGTRTEPTNAGAAAAGGSGIQVQRPRPRTLAAAMPQRASAGATNAVRRSGRAAMETKDSPFGAYDAALIAAIQERWYTLLDAREYDVSQQGKVAVEFKLRSDGRVTDLRVVENTVGELLGLLCQRAVLDPAPYARWPSDLERLVGSDSRNVAFSFYYGDGPRSVGSGAAARAKVEGAAGGGAVGGLTQPARPGRLKVAEASAGTEPQDPAALRAATRSAVSEALLRFGEASIPALVGVLRSGDAKRKAGAADLLVQLGRVSVGPVVEVLPDPSARGAAAGVLERLGEILGPRTSKALAGDAAALQALLDLQDPRVPGLLTRAAREADPVARAAAVTGLGQLDANLHLPVFLAAVGDPVERVRVAGVGGLGRIGDRLSVGVLLGLVWAPEIPVRNRAREALEALRSKPGMLGVFAALAQDDDLRTRLHATGYLVRRGDEPWGDFVSACVRTLVSPSSLGWGAVAAAAFAVLGFAWVRVLRPAVVPGLAGWTVLASVWTALWLYWRPSWGWTDGLGILLVLALTPAWAAFAASVAVGGVRWLSARGRMAGYVCRQHYHRFVPGPRLGWIERWTGRLLFKHRGGSAGDLAADTVCRACGQGANYAGVNTVVAVLDNADGRESWFQDGTLRVNWLRYRKPLDFERVEIVRAAETDVEAFVLQSRFQAEEAVRASLSRMLCVVGPEAKLEEKTLRVLRPVFGRVEERART